MIDYFIHVEYGRLITSFIWSMDDYYFIHMEYGRLITSFTWSMDD